jgi:acetyl-CoA C-acetyltransferase
MNTPREVVIASGVRTAIGTFGGSLKDQPATTLAAKVVKEAVKRAGIVSENVGACVIGNVIHSETRDLYMARVAALEGGLSHHSQAFTVNRLCGSGLQAVVSAAQQIMLGDTDIAVAGGVEVMSRAAYLLPTARWGQRMGNAAMVDMMIGGLTDPFENYHMGVTAENVAKKWQISRTQQDELAVSSHERALTAIDNGYFKEQILPCEIRQRKSTVVFDTDEHPRAGTSLTRLAKLSPVFEDDGSVTAGNASGINDAAAALVMMSRDSAEQHGVSPLARLVGYGFAGVKPKYMGIGPVPAIKSVMDKTGLTIDQMDTIELNEAFAAQVLACVKDLKLPMDKVNPNGSGISLGHPIGATGAILVIKALYELQRIQGRYGLISICIGGGQGIAAIIERIES